MVFRVVDGVAVNDLFWLETLELSRLLYTCYPKVVDLQGNEPTMERSAEPIWR